MLLLIHRNLCKGIVYYLLFYILGIPPGAGIPGLPPGLPVSSASLLMQGGLGHPSMAAAAAHLNSIRSGLADSEILRRHEELTKLSK